MIIKNNNSRPLLLFGTIVFFLTNDYRFQVMVVNKTSHPVKLCHYGNVMVKDVYTNVVYVMKKQRCSTVLPATSCTV